MCLIDFTQASARKLFKGRKTATLWKIVDVSKHGKSKSLLSPYQRVKIKTQDGYFVSNRSNPAMDDFEKTKKEVALGIHVYTYNPYPSCLALPPKLVIRVVCKKEDLVAANSYDAVFTKVKLTPKDIITYRTEMTTKKK